MSVMDDTQELTKKQYWDEGWDHKVSMRLPSKLNNAVRNFLRLMRPRLKPDMKVLEIGCAPGKYLALAAAELGVQVSGLDYSTVGIATCKRLFETLGLNADLRCENMFSTSFEDESFDIVYSKGVIEHFRNPAEAVEVHYRLLKRGGRAVIIIPNYSGIYGKLQRWLEPENLSMSVQNLEIMSTDALKKLISRQSTGEVNSYPWGLMSDGLVNWKGKFPSPLARLLSATLRAVSLMQPFQVDWLAPSLVLEFTRK
jgi:2-polyprenyl-3-methyl-5-hydroxy-6-metoxy-1,4-benzoquinol methylase